jgi:hypothetical protein
MTTATAAKPISAGRRFVESPEYRAARRAGGFTNDLSPGPKLEVDVLNDAELRAALHLRTSVNLAPVFDIFGNPFVGELPAVANVPQACETIPLENLVVLTDEESTENALATAVPVGTRLPEGSFNFGQSPKIQELQRFGVSEPVTLDVLDEPGRVESLINRRLEFGVGLGLENDILNGNNFGFGGGVGGLLANAGTGPFAKSSSYRANAIRTAIAEVQNVGWYVRPHQVVMNPVTMATLFEEEDGSFRPLPVMEMFDGVVDAWIVSKMMPAGQALVGDFFSAVAIFVKGPLTVAVSRNHLDFLKRGMAELVLEHRAFAWLRQPSALALVTGLS